MSKAISKMNKKELIEKIKQLEQEKHQVKKELFEKIKQLEQEKHEDKERFIGAGQIIKQLQEENDKKSKTLQQSGHTDFINTEKIKELQKDKEKADGKEEELCSFILALNLKDVFAKTIIRQRRTGRYVIDFSEVKKMIGEINCPEWEYGIEEQNIDKD